MCKYTPGSQHKIWSVTEGRSHVGYLYHCNRTKRFPKNPSHSLRFRLLSDYVRFTMTSHQIAGLKALRQSMSPDEWSRQMNAMKKLLADRAASLPNSLRPGVPYELVKDAPAMSKLHTMLFQQLIFEPWPPRMCYGYVLDSNKIVDIARERGCLVRGDPYLAGIVVTDAVEHIGKLIGRELELVQVWCDGDDTMIMSLCSNWDENSDIKKGIRAVSKFKEIIQETEKPKWYLDVLHSQWTDKPDIW